MKRRIAAILLLAAMSTAAFTGCQSGSGNDYGAESSTNSTASNVSTPSDNEPISGQISVITRERGSGTRDAFIELTGILVKGDDGTKTDNTSEDATILNNTQGVLSNVSGDKQAIGYISLGSLSDAVKAVKIDGVEPSVDTINDGTYKISRPFNIAVKKEGTSEAAQDFINYILSAEGQKVIADEGYVQINASAEAYQKSDVSGKVTIGGSTSVSPVMLKLQEAYKLVNPNVEIEIQTSDSSAGMTATMEGRCDIGMASRDLKDAEKEALTSSTIAKDGIVVVVNNENSTDSLTLEQVKQIFTGEVSDWSNLK